MCRKHSHDRIWPLSEDLAPAVHPELGLGVTGTFVEDPLSDYERGSDVLGDVTDRHTIQPKSEQMRGIDGILLCRQKSIEVLISDPTMLTNPGAGELASVA